MEKKEEVKEEDIKIPFFVTWVSETAIEDIHNVNVYIPSISEFELLRSKPVQWALQSILKRPLLIGEDVFFDKNYRHDQEARKSRYPFFLWPLANKILCNNINALIDRIYDYGEFNLSEIVTLANLEWLFFSPKSSNSSYLDIKPHQALKYIFDMSTMFTEFKIYWIEDQKRPFVRAGLKAEMFEENKINLYLLKYENSKCAPEKIISTPLPEKLYAELDKIISKTSFNVFIVDMYFILRNDNGSETKKILGERIIKRLRANESGDGNLRNLIIVFTHGSSPYIVSRGEALNADLVIFKSPVISKGSHHGHGKDIDSHSIDPQFLLIWSIFWPIAILHYICNHLKELLKENESDKVKELLVRTDMEVGQLCPEGVFFFWEKWIEELKKTLRKWNAILVSRKVNQKDLNSLREEIKTILKKSFYRYQ